jgi:hypothetical protein
VRSTTGGNPVVFRTLTLEGQAGIRSSVGSRVEDVTFRSISGIALELLSGTHEAERVAFGPGVTDGVRVAPGATLTLRRARFDAVTGVGLRAEGVAHVFNALLVNGGTALQTGLGGFLDVQYSTVVQNAYGVDNFAGATATVDHSIVYGNSSGDLLGVPCSAVRFSDTGDAGCAGQNGNLSASPMLGTTYRPQPGSPCLDAGDSPQLYNGQPATDLDGDIRLRDHDGDGQAQADLGAFEVANLSLSPGEVANLRWTSRSSLTWDVVLGATEYHVYRGNLRGSVEALSYAYFGTCHDEIDGDRTDTVVSVTTSPASGQGWFFLITAHDGSAVDRNLREGSLGLATRAERSNINSCVP